MGLRNAPIPPHPPELERALLAARVAVEHAERVNRGPLENLRMSPLLRAAHANINAALGRPGDERSTR